MRFKVEDKALSAYLWDFGGKFIKQGASLVITIILARILSPHDFGLLAAIVVFTSLSNVFSDMGLSGSIIQRTRILPIHLHSVFYFNLFIAFLMTLIMFFSAPLLGNYYGEPKLVLLARVMSISFILDAFNTIQNALIKKELNFKYFAKFRLISSVLSGIVGIILALNGYGVWALVVQMLLELVIYDFCVWKISTYTPKLQFSYKALKTLWGFGFRIFIAKFLNNLYQQLDILVIGKVLSFATLGFYQRAKSFNGMINSYSSESLMNIMFPLLSKMQNNKKLFLEKVNEVYSIILILSFFLSGLLFLISEDFIIILLTEKWRPTIDIFKIMVIGGFILPINGLFITVLSSKGNSKKYLKLEIIKKILFLLPLLFFIYSKNINSFLYLNLVIGIITLIINFYYIQDEIEVSWVVFFKPLLLYSTFVLAIIYSLNYLFSFLEINKFIHLITLSFTFTVLYVIIGIMLKLPGTNYLVKILKIN